MEYIEISAKTVDEAITEALVKLGTTSDRIEYEIVEKGNNGFLGIGRKDAVIKVRKKYSVNDDIKDFLNKVFEAMDLKVEIVMTAEENSNVINVDLKGDDMGVLIGKRGQTLDSLQYLTNLAVAIAAIVSVRIIPHFHIQKNSWTFSLSATNFFVSFITHG